MGYNEVPAINIKPPHYKVNDVNSLIHTMFHTYYPELSEPKPSIRRSSLKRPGIKINKLKSSQLLNHPLPSLPYSPDVQHFLKKVKFQYSDVTGDE